MTSRLPAAWVVVNTGVKLSGSSKEADLVKIAEEVGIGVVDVGAEVCGISGEARVVEVAEEVERVAVSKVLGLDEFASVAGPGLVLGVSKEACGMLRAEI